VATDASKLARLASVGNAFTPGAPIGRYTVFAGRLEQIMEIVTATRNPGQHVVLYGERGVGKTSLANVLSEIFETIDAKTFGRARVNCGTGDDFDSIWTNVFRELAITRSDDQTWVGLSPEDVRYTLSKIKPCIVVIDELDRLDNDETLTLLADTVKSLSDHAVPTTLVLVGVADSIDELIGDHQSIERALVQVPMPRMTVEELAEIIDKGIAELGMTITASARSRIARLSEGLPHYTHLLALHACQRAIGDDRNEVTDTDVDSAIKNAVDKAQHSIKSAYQRATRSVRRDNLFGQVLLACALAPKDELGFFTTAAVRAPMSRIMGRRYEISAFAKHMNKFTSEERGPILVSSGQRRSQFYRFQNPMMQPYVILAGLGKGLITEADLAGQAVLHEEPGSPELPL